MRDPTRGSTQVLSVLSSEQISVQVTDEGRGFDPESILDPTLPSNRLRAGGRGLFLIRKLMDRVEFNDRGNSIRMVLVRKDAAQPTSASG